MEGRIEKEREKRRKVEGRKENERGKEEGKNEEHEIVCYSLLVFALE